MDCASPRISRRHYLLGALGLALALAFLYQQLLLGRPLVRDDAALFVYPQHRALAQALHQGHLYLWDHQQWCGLPAVATGQSGALYPPHLLLFALLPWQPALHLAYGLHLLVAFIAMCWVARNLGVGFKPAAAGALVYTFSGYQAAHLIHYNFITATAHLPLLVAVLQLALRTNSRRWWALLGLEFALAFLCTHPQLFLMILCAGLLYLLAGGWRTGPEVPGGARRCRPQCGLILALLIGLLLCMPQLLPMLELVRESRGIYAADTLGAATFVTSYPFRALDLPRVVLPDLFGTVDNNLIGGGPAFHESCAFVGTGAVLLLVVGLVAGWGRRGWWFAFALLVVGAALMPAANPIYLLVAKLPVLGSFRAMGRWALVAIAGLSLLVSLGLQALPEVTPARRELALKLAWLVAVLLLVGLVAIWLAFGAERGSLTWPGHPGLALPLKNMAAAIYNCVTSWEPVLFVLGLVGALAGVQLLAAAAPPPADAGEKSRAAPAPQMPQRAQPCRRPAVAWLLLLLALGAPLWHFWQLTNRPGAPDYYTSAPATVGLAGTQGRVTTLPPALVSRDDSWRIGATSDVERELLTPAFGTVFGLSYSEGYKQGLVTPATLRLWEDYYRYGVQAFTGETTATESTVERVGTPVERMKRLHHLCGVRSIVTPGALEDPELARQAGAVNVYRYARAPLAWLVSDSLVAEDPQAQLEHVKQRGFDPYRLAVLGQPLPAAPAAAGAPLPEVQTEAEGPRLRLSLPAPSPAALLVISQAWYPGWRAFVDGKPGPLLRANFAFKAVPLPAGSRQVELRFSPASWRAGLLFGLLGLLLLAGACAWRRQGVAG